MATINSMTSTAETDDGFRGPQVCAIVGITYRQLDYWARTDLVRPSLHDAAGSGTQRRYSYRDLVELRVVKNLLDSGVSLQTARKAIEYLRDNLDTELASAHLVLEGSREIGCSFGSAVERLGAAAAADNGCAEAHQLEGCLTPQTGSRTRNHADLPLEQPRSKNR